MSPYGLAMLLAVVLLFPVRRAEAAVVGELGWEGGQLQLSAGTGYRRAAFLALDWGIADGTAVGGFAGMRFDRPAWTPTAGFEVRASGRVDRWNIGARLSAEWLGGLGGGGRLPGADLRLLGVAEVRVLDDLSVHAGTGAMLLAQEMMPEIVCLVARVGLDARVWGALAIGVVLDAPFFQVVGPDLQSLDATVLLRAAVPFDVSS